MSFGLVHTAHAADIDTLISKINNVIINPLIAFIFALALAYFLYGVVMFLSKKDSDTARADGKRHMLWGIVGMFVMVGVFGIINFIMSTVNG